jgi:hypothetical protein
MSPLSRQSKKFALTVRRKQREAERRKRYERIAKRFRPRKSEGQSFVLVGIDGKRLPRTSTRRGLLFYVTKTGRKYPVRIDKRAPLLPHKGYEYEVSHTGKKRAVRKYYARLQPTKIEPATIKAKRSDRMGLSPDRLSRRIGRDLVGEYGKMRGRQGLVLDVAVTYRLPNGKVRISNVRLAFSQAQITLLKSGRTDFLQGLIWKSISTELAINDLVTAGSRNHIRRLKKNRGRKRKFRTRKGDHWGKEKYATVKIVRVDFQISKVRIETGK